MRSENEAWCERLGFAIGMATLVRSKQVEIDCERMGMIANSTPKSRLNALKLGIRLLLAAANPWSGLNYQISLRKARAAVKEAIYASLGAAPPSPLFFALENQPQEKSLPRERASTLSASQLELKSGCGEPLPLHIHHVVWPSRQKERPWALVAVGSPPSSAFKAAWDETVRPSPGELCVLAVAIFRHAVSLLWR